MAVVNQDWYNLNESRPYPLADSATALDTEDNFLPSNIITDLRIRWPDWAGTYAFIGSVAVSPSIVTVTTLASPSLSSTSSYVPLAVVSVPIADLQEGRQYPFESMYPGAFGYITFGSGVTVNYSGRFLGPAQTLLTSRAANPHPGLPVTSLNNLNDQTPLTGLINLRADPPLFITKERRVINGDSKDAIVFSLREETNQINTGVSTEMTLQSFAGDCGKRPESGNCGAPNPIEFINSVGPDCNGMFTIEFTGCAVVGRNVSDLDSTSYSDDTIIIDCIADIEDTCDPPFLPRLSDGKLPSEFIPLAPGDAPPPVPPEPTPAIYESASEAFTSPVSLPHCETFVDDVADNFFDVGEVPTAGGSSAWTYEIATSPEDICRDESISASESVTQSGSYSTNTETGVTSRNMSVWYRSANPSEFPDTNQTIYRTFTADLRVVLNSTDTPLVETANADHVQQNGGLLVNYRIDPATGGRTFWTAYMETSVTPTSGKFGLYYFNGIQLVKLLYPNGNAAEFTGADLYPDVWYRLQLNVSLERNNHLNRNIVLSSTLTGPLSTWSSSSENTPQTLTIGNVLVPVIDYENEPTYGSDGESGLAGLYSHKSATQFSSWRVEDNRDNTPQWTL